LRYSHFLGSSTEGITLYIYSLLGFMACSRVNFTFTIS
jgi:hypothetical protein